VKVSDRGKARRLVQWWSQQATEHNRGLRLPWHLPGGRGLGLTSLEGRDFEGVLLADRMAPDQVRPLSVACNGRVLAANVATMSEGQEEALLPIRCNLESCPVCGEIGGFAHTQRASRVYQAIGAARSGWHVVLTVGDSQRRLTDPALVGLDQALRGIRSLLDCAARWVKKWWPVSVRVGKTMEPTGYYYRLRLHWSGDKLHGWEPHIHVLIGHDELGRMPRLSKAAFKAWREVACAFWSNQVRHAIGGGRITVIDAEPVDGSMLDKSGPRWIRRQEEDPAKRELGRERAWLHRVYYLTRPTWRLGWWADPSMRIPERVDQVRPAGVSAEAWRLALRDLYAAIAYGSVISRWSRAKSMGTPPDVVGLFDQNPTGEADPGLVVRARLVKAMGRLSQGLSPVTEAVIVEWKIESADYWDQAQREALEELDDQPATVDLGGFLWRPPGWWDTPARQEYRALCREQGADAHSEAYEDRGPPPRDLVELLKDARADLLLTEALYRATRDTAAELRLKTFFATEANLHKGDPRHE